MKKWLILLAVVAIGGGGYAFWHNLQKTKQSAKTTSRPSTAVVESRSINFVINAAGDIGPADQVSVRPEINGRISELAVDIGDKAKKGDLLATMDDQDLQTERATRLTEIDGTKLQLEKAQRNFERSKKLHAGKLVSLETFQDAQTEFELAKNALERSRKDLSQVEDKLSKTRIVAPFDCTVLTRPVSVGQAVSGSGGFNSGTEIMAIANLNDMIISSHVNQADVTRMKIDQTVEIEVEAVPGLKLRGAIERIAPQATIKNNIKGFATQIRLKDIDARVRPGMTANLTIPLISAENVLAVPLAAVFSDQGDRYVYVKKGEEEFEARPIQIGVADYQYAEVIQGVTAGETVSLVRPNNAPENPKSPKSGKKSAALGSSPTNPPVERAKSAGQRSNPGTSSTSNRSGTGAR